MGVIKQGILGGFSGSVGNVVGSSWKGIAVMKSKPLSVANPKSSGQVAQRGKFGMVVFFASFLLSSFIRPLWDRFSSKMSGYNSFVQSNIMNFDSTGILIPEGLSLSIGKIGVTPIKALTGSNASKSILITWDDDSGADFKLSTDECYIFVTNADMTKFGVSPAEVTRVDEAVTITLNENALTAEVYYCYMSFRRVDGTLVSTSSYKSLTI